MALSLLYGCSWYSWTSFLRYSWGAHMNNNFGGDANRTRAGGQLVYVSAAGMPITVNEFFGIRVLYSFRSCTLWLHDTGPSHSHSDAATLLFALCVAGGYHGLYGYLPLAACSAHAGVCILWCCRAHFHSAQDALSADFPSAFLAMSLLHILMKCFAACFIYLTCWRVVCWV